MRAQRAQAERAQALAVERCRPGNETVLVTDRFVLAGEGFEEGQFDRIAVGDLADLGRTIQIN